MDYRGVLTVDYDTVGRDNNEYQRLLNALEQAGWDYAETSAMYIECSDMEPIRLAFELLARASATPGTLTALTLQVQLVGPPRQPPAIQNHRRALDKMLTERPLPSESR